METKTQIWEINNIVKEIYTATRVSIAMQQNGADEIETEKALKSIIKNPIQKLNEILNTAKEQ